VSVFNVPDLTRTVQVADTGTINYPLVGEVRAAGQTAHELERGLGARLSHYVQSPQVTVLVKEFNSQRVTISGSVKSTGVYPMKGNTSLMQLLAMAGDTDVNISSGEVVIFRTINGTRSAARFDFDAIRAGKADDPQLQPGDVIVVDTSPAKVALSNIMKVLPLLGAAAIFTPL
jgi:polysaccharide biosynthesis/export protein